MDWKSVFFPVFQVDYFQFSITRNFIIFLRDSSYREWTAQHLISRHVIYSQYTLPGLGEELCDPNNEKHLAPLIQGDSLCLTPLYILKFLGLPKFTLRYNPVVE